MPESDLLFVDDSDEFIAIAEKMIDKNSQQLNVTTFTSPMNALSALEEQEFDCVVSDYDMPKLDGLTLFEKAREVEPEIPFILFTGKGSEEIASRAISAGVTDYLQKKTTTEQFSLLANRVETAVESHKNKRKAQSLSRVRQLVGEVNEALIHASTCEAIEQRVCDIFTNSDPYKFSWVGRVDQETQVVRPSAWSGVSDEYLDNIEVTTDDSETGKGPGGQAARTREVAVAQNIFQDPSFEPWRTQAEKYGFRSVAAIPLEYDGELYGLLGFYADRTNAFDQREKRILKELGDSIGHAIQRAVKEDELVQFRQAVDQLNSAVYMTDEDGIINYTNQEFDTLEISNSVVLEKTHVSELFDRGEKSGQGPWRGPAQGGGQKHEVTVRHEDHSYRSFIEVISPISTGSNQIVGYVGTLEEITDHKRRQDRLANLNRTSQHLLEATSKEDVAEHGVNAMEKILDIRLNAIHLLDEETEKLEPVAYTDRVEAEMGEPPALSKDEGITGLVFDRGEPAVYDDVREEPAVINANTDYPSHMYLPLDDHGIMIAGAEEPSAFDTEDTTLGKILAGTLAAALSRVDHEAELRQQEAELRRQNEALDEFASVVAHDLRNPLNTAEGYIQLAREQQEIEHLETAAEAIDQSESLIEDLLSLARGANSDDGTQTIELSEFATQCWSSLDTDAATLDVCVSKQIVANRTRLQQLFENLFKNAVEYTDGDVSVTVGEFQDGIYIEDDGCGIPPEDRESVFDAGYTTSEDGTGFGLRIVQKVVTEHGWDISIAESDAGGARFEITGIETAVEGSHE